MTIATLDDLPDYLTAGDLLSWLRPGGDYDPATDTCKTDFVPEAGGTVVSVTGTDNGDTRYAFETAGLSTAGIWHFRRYIVDGADELTVERGTIEALPGVTTGDQRSAIKRTLDALDALLEGKASQDQLAYSIGNRQLSRLSPSEVIEFRQVYMRMWQAEKAKQADPTRAINQGEYRVRF